MASKTLSFLPTIFQTDTNEKFLSATIDQLLSEPDLKKVYGYIGRTFAPTYKNTDSYIQEISTERQNYQLEPSVVIKDSSNNITFYSSYIDLLNKIKFYGGIISDHNRLFENEYYSFDPLIDYDKFVNFSQYYWIPGGPEAVDVATSGVEFNKTYTVIRNSKNNAYEFSTEGKLNPTIILARGGTYNFNIDQVGYNFWIQSELGQLGKIYRSPNISSRNVYGVENNGSDTGTITFTVPQFSAQGRYIEMPMPYIADFTTSLTYSDIQNTLVSQINNHVGFDGMISQLDGKTFVFVDQDKISNQHSESYVVDPNEYETAWTVKGTFDILDWNETNWDSNSLEVWDKAQFTLGETVPESDRVALWTIKLIPSSNILTFSGNITAAAGMRIVQELSGASALVIESVINSNFVKVHYENAQIFTIGAGPIRVDNVSQTVYPITTPNNDYLITLFNYDENSNVRSIAINEKVYIKTGVTNANKEFYRDYDGLLKEVPLITSTQDIIYYQDGTSTKLYGEIQIVDLNQWSIDVNKDILNKKNYTSPNGIVFTNGLKIKFGIDVLPESYQNTEFYIEGVGTSITLTAANLLVIPEEYHSILENTYGNQIFPDYILINRSSLDLNPWSRNNYWFHSDVIALTNKYNHPTSPIIYDQTLRASRPIIEFEPNIKLSNNGKIGKKAVDILDTTTFDAFNSMQGQSLSEAYGISLTSGLRLIFSVDQDPLVQNKIYVINLIYPHIDEISGDPIGLPIINLIKAVDGDIEEYDSVVVTNGYLKGSSWWFNGVSWIQGQQKTTLNQSPYFDVFDNNGVSYTDYPKVELVANLANTENSVFNGTKIFGYKILSSGVADPVLGFPLSYRNFSTQGEIEFQNYFDTDVIQYNDTNIVPVNNTILHQTIDRYTFNQRNIWNTVAEVSKQYQSVSYQFDNSNIFIIPVEPASSESTIPYIKVYKNSKLLSTDSWEKINLTISILVPMIIGDKIDIFIFSDEVADSQTYQIPLNLDFNAQNLNFTSLTLGQLRNHVTELAQNSNIMTGSSVGANNLRDIQYKQQGGNILQHSAPVPYASLFLIDETTNFITATNLAQQEYNRFKNKFLELCVNMSGINGAEPANGVDQILASINSFKNSSFPWYYSDMVPYGPNKNVIDIVIYDPLVKSYEITKVFDDTLLSSNAVLVYLDADPLAVYLEGTGIDVTSDILTKSEYVSPTGVVFENDLKIRFGSSVTPASYRNNSYQIEGVGNTIALVSINNNVQLIKGTDYIFDQTRPAIIISNDVLLEVDYRITVVEYYNTDGSYIPETPTKLGLYPKFRPEIVEDNTYRTTINVIIGHDGSKTPAFGDFRDDYLLELEKRIYNNIKVNPANIILGINDFVPGKFRNTKYSLNEFNTVLNQSFLTWVGNNKLDYSSNLTFQSNDPFTWNYSLFSDVVNGEKLPGSWRAIYKYFFDTESPHQTPWEMLGFSERPDWWIGYYGPAPYTGSNALLWEHLSKGRIVDGARVGIDERYSRPSLTSIIPVDVNGFLRSPLEFLTATFNSKNAATAWAVGNQGPVEAAWRHSSDFPYAMQIAMALTKPAIYFSNLIDTQNYRYDINLNQYTIESSKQHIKQSEILVNGKNSSGIINRCSGYLNWIADQLTNQGIDPYSKLNSIISNYQVNLSYKVAGFTDQSYLKILAEQYSPTSTNDSIIIPNENYKIHLNKSTPVQKISYSAVIVEKTNNGYSVRGYNLLNPYFTIIPSIVNSHSSKIRVLNEEATIYFDYQFMLITVPYGYEFTNQQQLVDFLISYERYLQSQGFTFTDVDDTLGEVRNWQLSSKEFLYWTQQGWPTNSILVLSPVANTINVISNGTIVDEIMDSTTGARIVDQNFTIIKNIEYTVLRSPTQFKVSLTNDQIIGLVTLNLVQYEHVLVFDNITVFNDVIYKPELGNRQFRLKLIGQKTNNWDGSLSPAGFIYNSTIINDWNPGHDYLKGDLVKFKSQYYVSLNNLVASDSFIFSNWKQINYNSIKTGLLPNFASIANRSLTYYDSYAEANDTNENYFQGGHNSNQSHYGYGLIGFKSRDYLDNLGLTDATQVELYKGFIKQKGTINAVNALTNAQFNATTGKIDFYEEWGVRVGAYGALDINPSVDVRLDEKTFSTNAQVLEFVDISNASRANSLNIIGINDLYKSTGTFDGTIANNRNNLTDYTHDIPSVGFASINDVDLTIFDLTNFVDLNSEIVNIGSGHTIWCAKDFSQSWNIYRITETNNFVTTISNALDGFISLTCHQQHNLVENDIILLKDFNAEFDGFYQLYKVVNLNTFLVKYTGLATSLTTVTSNGMLFTLDSLRFEYMENVRLNSPLNGWQVGEKVWIDKVTPDNEWGVYEKKNPWTFAYSLTKAQSEYASNDGFGTSLKINDNSTIIAVGSPYNTLLGNGIVDILVKTSDNTFVQDSSLSVTPTSDLTLNFGYSLEITESLLVVGAPASESNRGHVYLYYKEEGSPRFIPLQIIRGNTGDQLGNTVSLSQDGYWLYIGAVGTGKVYAYALDIAIIPQRIVTYVGPTLSSNIPLGTLTPNSANELAVYGNGVFYIADIDYTLSIDKTYITILPGSIPPTYNIAIEVTHRPNFVLIDTIVGTGPTTDQFGYAISISADGAQLGVGAPGANVTVNGTTFTNAGKVYVYDRTIEAFTSTGNQTFTTTNPLTDIKRVTSDGVEVSSLDYNATTGGYTVVFNSPIDTGSIVTIETNKFNLLQTLTGSDPQFESRHGTSLAICSFNCAIYIGAPGFDVTTGIQNKPENASIVPVNNKGIIVNSGAVFKNHNQGRLYGTIAGTTITPTVTPTNSTRLNDFEVTFTGFSQVVDNGTTIKQLALSENITANVGDYITQTSTGANVTVLSSTSANVKLVSVSGYINANAFTFGSSAGNISINGVATSGVKPVADLESVISDINNKQIIGITASIEVKITRETYTKDIITDKWYDSSNSIVTDIVILTYLNDNDTSPIVLVGDIYKRINRIWKNSENIIVTDSLLTTLLENSYYLRLDSESKIARNKMRVLSGIGTPIADLGLDVFYQMQILTSPDNILGEQFGTKLSLEKGAHQLVISSKYGSTIVTTIFDDDLLTFDDNSTHYKEAINSSGAAYLFELYDDPRDSVELPGRYSFTQQFNPGDLNTGDQFGWATDISGKFTIISAPNDGTIIPNGGSVYLFENITSETGWTQISKQTDKVDINSISRQYLYNNIKNQILQNLQIIDPNKGKILGQAEQEITYKTTFDPAIYNKGFNTTVNISTNNWWSSKQTYQIWWNLDTVRYIDYEQGDLTYRSLNWGKTFPGSSIDIYEWTESIVLPSQYVLNGGDGTPLYIDDSAYVEEIAVDPTTGTILIKYYFWVTNKTTLTAINSYRTLPTMSIKELIENPSGQNIPYAALIQNNALSFYNISDYLSGTDISLHITHGSMTNNSNIIHSEYALIKNGPNTIIPLDIINRSIDSLSGINLLGQSVPDPRLTIAEKYGISVRPRQTMFIDRLTALTESVDFINSKLIQYQIINIDEITLLNSEDPMPQFSSGLWDMMVPTYETLYYYNLSDYADGYRILVEADETQNGLWIIYIKIIDDGWQVHQVQSYKTNQYWHTVDWYAQGFDESTHLEFIAIDNTAALKLPYAHGDIIKILNDGNGKWRLVQVVDIDKSDEVLDLHNEFETIGIQDGTIQLDEIGNYLLNKLGFSNQGFDEKRFDENPGIETRYLLAAIIQMTEVQSNIKFKTLFTDLLFVLINYIHTEQPYIDWIFKTSFVTVLHQLRSLIQTPNYTNENQTYYEDYINEVKPYKTKIREYVTNYTGDDLFDGNLTDFDLPAYYDINLKMFRSPSGEIPLIDDPLWQNPVYKEWYDNRSYEIGNIIVSNPGIGYTSIPLVEIISSTGSGATAHAVIDANTGTITDIIVDNAGTGYSSTVIININGNGSGATAYAIFNPNQVRAISTTIKFDRIGYNSLVTNWKANTTYTSGDIVSYNNTAYIFNNDEITGNITSFTSTDIIDFTNLTIYNANAFVVSNDKISMGANDRIIGYYDPTNDMPAIETSIADIVTSNVTINSNVIYITSVANLQKGMYISGASANISMITEIVANISTGINYIHVDRVQSLANGSVLTATHNSLGQLISGIEYPGVQVIGSLYEESAGFDVGPTFGRSLFDQVEYDSNGIPILSSAGIDSLIQSNYTDDALGTRPEDIDIIGGSFVDNYSSHAPEELIPGIIFDTLDIKVFTTVNGSILAYRIFNNMLNNNSYLRIGSNNTTTLTANLNMLDTQIQVSDAIKLPQPNKEFRTPGVVFINSERITYYRNYAHEVTPWAPNITFVTDSVLSYGNLVTFSSNITITQGDYISQPSTGALALVTTDVISQPSASMYYLNSNVFVLGSGNIQVVDSSNIANVLNISAYPISSNIAYYKTTSDILSTNFSYMNVSPLADNNINILSQIRRGTEGTGTSLLYLTGTTVVDGSELQLIPNTSINTTTSTSTPYHVTNEISTILQIEGTITANIGDIITQTISGANVFVSHNVIDSNLIFVTSEISNNFTYGNLDASYGLIINGTLIIGAYPQASTITGHNMDIDGNVTIIANTTLISDKIWNKIGVGVATDGSGFGSGTSSTWTEQETFLWANTYL